VSPADVLAGVLLLGLIAYVLLGGADFGGGVWDLLATGPRARAQRRLIEHALAPVWEANHVWLIAVIVLLFSGFPRAFAAVSVALHIPLTLVLLGIVLRGSAFVFRQYGAPDDVTALRWGRVFAVASTVTPVFLGVTLGAITADTLRLERGVPAAGFVRPWLGAFPLSVGLLALAAFSFLAATYLTVEARDDAALREDFRRRALLAGGATAAGALLAGALARGAAPRFFDALVGSGWSIPLGLGAASALGGSAVALARGAFRAERPLAAGAVALVTLGWGLAQRPVLVGPDLTIAASAAPPGVLWLLLGLSLAGALLVAPALYALLRVFKTISAEPESEVRRPPEDGG
jgi:cytochrome bd ubiquinol oxidase subunit II